MMFVTNGTQSAETTRNSGEWWYKTEDGLLSLGMILMTGRERIFVKIQFTL